MLLPASFKAQYNLKYNSNWVLGTYSGISFNNYTFTPRNASQLVTNRYQSLSGNIGAFQNLINNAHVQLEYL